MSDTIVIDSIVEKTGEKDGRPWTRYALKDGNGNFYSTFSESVIEPLRGHEGQRAEIEYETKVVNNRPIMNLKTATLVEESPISNRGDDGEPDWDLIGLRKTRCALWDGFLNGQLAASIYLKASNTEGVEPRDSVVRAGLLFVVAAERDIFQRESGDDGIPL